MENKPENANEFSLEHQQEQTDNNSSLASDGPVSKSEGTAGNDLTDASAEDSEENAGIGFGGIPSTTDYATANDDATDLDTDIIANDNGVLEQARASDITD